MAPSEKQTLLAHTRNATNFAVIRQALNTWWENDEEVRAHDTPGARACYADPGELSDPEVWTDPCWQEAPIRDEPQPSWGSSFWYDHDDWQCDG